MPSDETPLLTAIVSTYAAERFIRGCLQDLVEQTLFPRIEVLVIDSGSPQGESAIAAEFAARHPQIRVLRTEREPLYAAWNRAIGLARGRYLSNANTDDRHRPDYFERAVALLEAQPEVGLVYADQLISTTENETFAQCQARGARVRRWPEYAPVELIERCITGSQPVWRAEWHRRLGLFDLSYRIAADYDMWLRIAEHASFARLPEPMGVLYETADTMSGSGSRSELDREILRIKRHYLGRPAWKGLPGARERVARVLFSAGYRHIELHGDTAAARPFLREALRLQPLNPAYLKTYLLRCVIGLAGPARP